MIFQFYVFNSKDPADITIFSSKSKAVSYCRMHSKHILLDYVDDAEAVDAHIDAFRKMCKEKIQKRKETS